MLGSTGLPVVLSTSFRGRPYWLRALFQNGVDTLADLGAIHTMCFSGDIANCLDSAGFVCGGGGPGHKDSRAKLGLGRREQFEGFLTIREERVRGGNCPRADEVCCGLGEWDGGDTLSQQEKAASEGESVVDDGVEHVDGVYQKTDCWL